MRIALCDDDEDFRMLLGRAVRDDPELELVATAPGVEQLRNALPGLEVDGLLLDWMLAGPSQEVAVRELRAALPGAVIVVLSAVVRSSAEQRALAAGADGYVEKGAGARELLTRCKRFLVLAG